MSETNMHHPAHMCVETLTDGSLTYGVVLYQSDKTRIQIDALSMGHAHDISKAVNLGGCNVFVVDEERDELVNALRACVARLERVDQMLQDLTKCHNANEVGEVVRARALLAKVQA